MEGIREVVVVVVSVLGVAEPAVGERRMRKVGMLVVMELVVRKWGRRDQRVRNGGWMTFGGWSSGGLFSFCGCAP